MAQKVDDIYQCLKRVLSGRAGGKASSSHHLLLGFWFLSQYWLTQRTLHAFALGVLHKAVRVRGKENHVVLVQSVWYPPSRKDERPDDKAVILCGSVERQFTCAWGVSQKSRDWDGGQRTA